MGFFKTVPEGQGGGEQLLDDSSALLSAAMMPTALQCSNSTNSENIIWIVQAKCALYTILCLQNTTYCVTDNLCHI